MRIFTESWAPLLPFFCTLAACSGSSPTENNPGSMHAAWLYVLDDVSSTSAAQGEDVFGAAVRNRVGDAVEKLKLGDSIAVYELGSRTAERFVAHPTITTGYKLHLKVARKRVVQQMQDIATTFRTKGGDGGTNLLLTLENLRPDCASGRSTILIVSDGVEESEAYSASKQLATGKPVNLPLPSGPILQGCRVVFLGFGVSADASGTGHVLPDKMLNALRLGWEKYLKEAGAIEVTFTSLI